MHACALEFRNFKRVWSLCYTFSMSTIMLFLPLGSNDCQQFPCSLEVILYEFNQAITLLQTNQCYVILGFSLVFVTVLSNWQNCYFPTCSWNILNYFFFTFKTYSLSVQLQIQLALVFLVNQACSVILSWLSHPINRCRRIKLLL